MLRTHKRRWTGILLVLLVVILTMVGCEKTSRQDEAMQSGPTKEQLEQLFLLNETAANLYTKINAGDVEAGRELLAQFGDQMTQIRFEGVTTVEGVAALAESVTNAKRLLNAATGHPAEAQVAVAKIRLAADALTHKHQPLWSQQYNQLVADIDLIEQAAKAANLTQLRQGADQLKQHVDVIHPSLVISRDAADVEKMDSLLTFISIQTSSSQEPFHNMKNVIPHLRETVDQLFMQQHASVYLPIVQQKQPVLWTLSFGLVIVTALVIAGWRLSRKDDIVSA